MFHIKEDKRSEASAALIAEAMLKLLEEKEFKNITITDLQKESSVGRATFYRLFDRTEDVLEYLLKMQTNGYYEQYRDIQPEMRPPLLRFAIDCFMDNYYLLEHIVQAGKIGIIFRVLSEELEWMADLVLTDEDKKRISDRNLEYFCAMMTAETVGVLETWLSRGKKETPEELFDILRSHQKYDHYLYDTVRQA